MNFTWEYASFAVENYICSNVYLFFYFRVTYEAVEQTYSDLVRLC